MKSKKTVRCSLCLLMLLVVVLAACARNDDTVATNTVSMSEGDSTPTPTPTPADANSGESSNTTSDTSSQASNDASALEAMEIIEEQVSTLRGLDTQASVTKAFLNTDELRQKLVEDIAEDYSQQEAHDDVLLYAAFDLIDRDIDLYDLFIDLYTEQVAGFYDPDTKEMFVVKGTREPGALERMTYSHEYTHVLQDQHFDLQALGFTDDDDDEDEDSEKDFAIRSLVEGDAVLLMQQYALMHLDADALREIIDQSTEIDTTILDSAPAIVRQSLLFPFEAGLIFVLALFNDGGWSAVDDAYANPPVSTEQIIHPERYPDDVPQIVTLPPLTDTLGAGWRLVNEDVLGEFGLQQYLQVRTDQSDAEVAAEGWGGDRYAVHWRDDESAFVLVARLAWDTLADADEFFNTYVQFAENRFGSGPNRSEGATHLWWSGEDVLLLARNDQDDTLVIIAPDETTLAAVNALFADFR